MYDQAIFEVNVGGTNISEKINPILEQLRTNSKSGTTSDTASITLNDIDATIEMPSVGESCTILLGWSDSGMALVFEGTIDDVRSRGSRGGGRNLVVGAKGFDSQGKAKEPLEMHKDKSSLEGFMSEAAGKAGLSFSAQGEIGSIMRDYWVAGTESFIHLGHRIAKEVGGTFKIIGDQAYMWPRNTPLFAAGGGGGSVSATWPGNLIDWNISPTLSRPRFGNARGRWYDVLNAKYMEEKQSIGFGEATHTHRFMRADKDEAKNATDQNKRSSQRESGSGHVLIMGEPGAQAEGMCSVSGVRPGIDGGYRIDSVEHILTRGSGFHTHIGLKQPQGE